MNINENLALLAQTKENIRQAIITMGGSVESGTPFSAYTQAILAIPTSISFNYSSYTMSGTTGIPITVNFNVTDNNGNDVSALCDYTCSPNNKGLDVGGDGSFTLSDPQEGTYSVVVTATYNGLSATTTVNISIQSIPEGLHKFSISQSQWPDCAIMVEAYYNPDEIKKGETGSQTVNIYTDPSGEPINSITYDCYVIGGATEVDVQNTNANAGVYCTNSSDWMPYETNPLAFKIECRTAGTYYIEVVGHTNPRFYDDTNTEIYPNNY